MDPWMASTSWAPFTRTKLPKHMNCILRRYYCQWLWLTISDSLSMTHWLWLTISDSLSPAHYVCLLLNQTDRQASILTVMSLTGRKSWNSPPAPCSVNLWQAHLKYFQSHLRTGSYSHPSRKLHLPCWVYAEFSLELIARCREVGVLESASTLLPPFWASAGFAEISSMLPACCWAPCKTLCLGYLATWSNPQCYKTISMFTTIIGEQKVPNTDSIHSIYGANGRHMINNCDCTIPAHSLR